MKEKKRENNAIHKPSSMDRFHQNRNEKKRNEKITLNIHRFENESNFYVGKKITQQRGFDLHIIRMLFFYGRISKKKKIFKKKI